MALLSFIVPAHNEEQLLGRTLATLHLSARATRVPYEIVVVDDSSTDDTAAIARQHGARVVRVGHRQISRTRNAGAAAAGGDRLIFVDADTLVPVATLRATLRAWDSGVVAGGASVHLDGRLPWGSGAALRLFRAFMRRARYAAGCYLFCTRHAFEATGGFPADVFAGEELYLSRALRRQGAFVVLPELVHSSGRKLRTVSCRELFRLLLAGLTRGTGAVRSRRYLDVWYGERRRDPDRVTASPSAAPESAPPSRPSAG
jgi:glycosyltransferase involved in cell wall biosynthesis